MNQVLTDLHNKRYEWAFHAKQEFLDQFVRLDVQKLRLLHNTQENSISSDSNINPFLSLTNCFKLAENERKLEYDESVKELDKLEQLIFEKKEQIEQKLNFFHMKNHEFSSKIENYTEFSNDIEAIIQKMKNTDWHSFVKNILKYDVNHKKASILNRHAIKLQMTVEKSIKNQLIEIKERADYLRLKQVSLLRLPKLDPIPIIQQKIDSYWLTSRYEKAYNRVYHNAHTWVEQMYNAFRHVLTPLLNESLAMRDQLLNEAESMKWIKEEMIVKLQNELTELEGKRDVLCDNHAKVNEMWEQDCEHAKRLQGYFIKHWLSYKVLLQCQFLSKNPKERWVVSHYLQQLQQDGENIIDSMNI